MGQAVHQHQVGAGANRQVQVGRVAGGRLPGIHHYDRDAAGLAPFALQQPLKQHRMALRRVGADQEGHGAVVEILVAAGGAIGAEAAGIARHCRTHAQARVGIEVVGADRPLEQLLGDVVVLDVKLAGAIHGDRTGALAGQGAADPGHDAIDGLIPADRLEGLIQAGASQRLAEPSVAQGVAHRGPLDAHLPKAGGMAPIPPGAPEGKAVGVAPGGLIFGSRGKQLQATAHAAVGALGAHRAWWGSSHGAQRTGGQKRGRPRACPSSAMRLRTRIRPAAGKPQPFLLRGAHRRIPWAPSA